MPPIVLIILIVVLAGIVALTVSRVNLKGWQDFLDSLSTKGGNIFMLFSSLMVLIGLMLHLTHDATRDAAMMAAAHDMMIGFGGALLGSLSGSSSRQQMRDRVDTALTGIEPKTPVTPPPAPPPDPAPGEAPK